MELVINNYLVISYHDKQFFSQGKESIDSILEMLRENASGLKENFANFSRVSIRRLGRLLPDARWVHYSKVHHNI
jgi:hypothetical protein